MSRAWIGLLAVSAALVGVAAASPDETAIEDRLRAQLLAERADTRAMRRAHAGALVTVRERHARQVRGLRRTMLARPSVDEAIRLASATYGIDIGYLRRLVQCESRGDPKVVNTTPVGREHATGLAQFLPSTYRTTPQGRAGLSITSAYANALAAGWLLSQPGGPNHWHCSGHTGTVRW